MPKPQELVDAINAERAKNKLPALKPHPILMADAQKHAEYMASSGVIAHESADGSRPFQRHLAAARARLGARGEGQLSVGPQPEVPVPERVGDLAQELEAVEDEREAVADEAARDLDLLVEVGRCGTTRLPSTASSPRR